MGGIDTVRGYQKRVKELYEAAGYKIEVAPSSPLSRYKRGGSLTLTLTLSLSPLSRYKRGEGGKGGKGIPMSPNARR